MESPLRSIHLLAILAAVLGGAFAILAMIAGFKKFLTKKSIDKIYYIAYGLMALSMFLWVIGGLVASK